jgi:HD-like signal output (HDOD) protein
VSDWMTWWWLLLPLALLWYALRKPRRRQPRSVSRPAPPAATSQPITVPSVAKDPVAPQSEAQLSAAPPEWLQDFVLFRSDKVTEEQRARIEELVVSMRRPHPMFAMLTASRDGDDALMDQIASDPGLAATALKTVNSPAFGLDTPIESVQRAVAYLGLNYVRGLILEAAMGPALKLATYDQTIAARRLWNAGAISSAVALSLTQQLGIAEGSVIGTHALLSRIGDLCLVSQGPDLAAIYEPGKTLLNRLQYQQRELSVNSMMIGAALAGEWGLPSNLQSSVAYALFPMALPVAEHPLQGEALRNSVLIFIAYRIGERAVFAGERDVGLIDLYRSGHPELYYLPEYLRQCGLTGLPALLANPSVRRSLNRLLSHFVV